MATQTQTMRRAPVQAERVHDYLYDKVFHVSSERDHARATFQAHTSTDRVKRVPAFNTMFSELRHHPRFEMRLDVTDPVPKFVQRQWRGYGEQAREALIRYKQFNYDPSVQIPKQAFPEANVTGQNRYKFFRSGIGEIPPAKVMCSKSYRRNRRHGYGTADEFWYVKYDRDYYRNKPIIPFLQQVPPEVLLATARQDPLAGGADQQAMLERPPTPLTRTVEIQTDYRDSEAQTDPFTPEYVVRPGSQPELLTLATLSHGRGLPAGLSEVEMIERARAKRAWEATLPPLNDTDQLDKRRKMMDEMERKEWALREHEIEKLQEARLEVLKNLLRTREENNQELNTKRLDRLWAKKQEMKEDKVKKIRNEHIKTIRKLTEKRRRVEGKLERRDIVHDYSEYGSGVYAPMTRVGVFLDRGSEQFVVKSRFLNSFQGLMELEHSLPDFVTAPRIKAPKPKTVTKSGFVKRRYRQERELAEIHEVIKEQRTRVQEPPKPLKFLQKIEKPIPRPPTPTVDVPSEEEENRELGIIFLQQIIRGRAIQNMMFEGKEKRIELIRELRSTHALQEAEAEVKRQEKQATLALQRQRRLHDHKESFVDEALSQLEGESLGDSLDFLSKELVRLQEERRIHAFSMLAERQRRIREAEESGRRQLEERRRREEDEIFKQVLSVHQDTVDTYLEDIILGAVDSTADEQARKEIEAQAGAINDIAYQMEDNRTQLQSEEIVSELVHGFLLPEVQKISMRGKVQMQQRQFLNAAHKEIYRDGEGVIDMYPKAAPAAGGSSTAPAPTATKSQPTTPTASRPGSAAAGRASPKDKPASPKGSASGRKSQSPALEKKDSSLDLTISGSKPGSRPSSAQQETTDQPSSSRRSSFTRQTSKDNANIAPASPVTSRPQSADKQATQSPATSRPPSGRKSRPTSAASRPSSAAKDSTKPGSARESPKPGSARESPKPGSARESPKPGSARESPKPGSARESPKPGSARESPKPGSARESPKPGSARESPKPGSARESPKTGSARESPKPGSARESPKPGSARESPKPGSARESPKPQSARESPKPGSARESPKPQSARESPKPGSTRNSPEPAQTETRDSPKPPSPAPAVQETSDSPKPGLEPATQAPTAEPSSPVSQSPKPLEMADQKAESPKPSSARGSPKAQSPVMQNQEQDKPASARQSPAPVEAEQEEAAEKPSETEQ